MPLVTKFDGIPGFWNYLVGLDRNDLIAELVQNDLDQGATRTVISFEKSCLICEGNGAPVEREGWQRLQMLSGAGHKVPAKRNGLGVKNHGLKTAFTIGDEIRLMSAGQAIIQTLYADGRDKRPRPAASEYPMEDSQAPLNGCRVVVQYRIVDLEPTQGEAIELNAVGPGEIEALFESACANIPEQFAGIVSPEVTPRYEIVLRHWKLGKARFRFSSTQPRKIAKRIEVFQRRCLVDGTFSRLPDSLREQAVRRLVRLQGKLRERVAYFFRRKRSFFVEASWPIDAKGKPKIGAGKYRYPLGYPLNSPEARTGHGTYFNAPFVSDNKRRAPARNEATYAELQEACDSLLVDALGCHVIPRWKADGLNPLVPNSDVEGGDEAARPLLAKLATGGKLPVLKWRQVAALEVKRKRGRTKLFAQRLADRNSSKNKRRYRFVVPALTWKEGKIEPLLSLLCPPSEMQLDPRVDSKIIRLLTEGETLGFCEEFITFDENDVIHRITANGNEYFNEISAPDREFGDPFIARPYLDLLWLLLNESKLDDEKEHSLFSTLCLPDIHGQATEFSDLYSIASLPLDIPGLCLPPIIDKELSTHPLFKRKKWRLRKFTITEFLESGTLQSADQKTNRMFWKWLSQNGRHIASRDRPKLANLTIWPDKNNNLCRISDLCEPRSKRVKKILSGFIRRPSEQVLRSKLTTIGNRARTSIRVVPSQDEVEAWLDTQLMEFEIGSWPDSATASKLGRFGGDICVLLKDRSVAPIVKKSVPALPALARDGSIRLRKELVLPSRDMDRLSLPDRFLLKDRKYANTLAKIAPALSTPTATMFLYTFDENPDNTSALQPRLREFLRITELEGCERRELAEKPIIPVKGKFQAPRTLAFISTRGDYWGVWKTRVTTEGLSQDDQRRYRAAGVTSALPNPETSRDFFVWLAAQDQDVLQQHIPCVLRHFLHRDGPVSWAQEFTDIRCIPTTNQRGLQLVSWPTARRNPVFLSDAGDIEESIIEQDSAVQLVIHKAREVREPISKQLRCLGVRSLRETLKEPETVTGTGNVASVNEEIRSDFLKLKSSRFQRTFPKRLDELGIELELLRRDWQDRLDRVQKIHFCEEIEIRFRFRRKPYVQNADAGFDPGTGIFWVRRDIGSEELYKSLAKQLVFKPNTPPIYLYALGHALKLEIKDPSYGQPLSSQSHAHDGDTAMEDSVEYVQAAKTEGVLGEVKGGHLPFEPDPTRNIPRPGPFSIESAGSLRRSRGESHIQRPEESEVARHTPILEREHIEELKRNHYAYHCQMCLCNSLPQELAPIGSYIESAEVRKRVVEAHHPDLVEAGGARHAGNLVLLCKLHHDNYGRQMTRAAIGDALRNNSKRKSIRYDRDFVVNGKQIEFVISATGEIVKLFFTDHHVEYWLLQESPLD